MTDTMHPKEDTKFDWRTPIVTAIATAIFTGASTYFLTSHEISEKFASWEKQQIHMQNEARKDNRVRDIKDLIASFNKLRNAYSTDRQSEINHLIHVIILRHKPIHIFGEPSSSAFLEKKREIVQLLSESTKLNMRLREKLDDGTAEFYSNLTHVRLGHAKEISPYIEEYRLFHKNYGEKYQKIEDHVERIIFDGIKKTLDHQSLYSLVMRNKRVDGYIVERDLREFR